MCVLTIDDYVVLQESLPQFNLRSGDVGVIRDAHLSLSGAVAVDFLPPDAQEPIRVPVKPELVGLLPRIDLGDADTSDLFSKL